MVVVSRRIKKHSIYYCFCDAVDWLTAVFELKAVFGLKAVCELTAIYQRMGWQLSNLKTVLAGNLRSVTVRLEELKCQPELKGRHC